MKLWKKYGLYLGRWQLSTFVLAPVAMFLNDYNAWIQIIVGNLIGGLLFFWIDKKIFGRKK